MIKELVNFIVMIKGIIVTTKMLIIHVNHSPYTAETSSLCFMMLLLNQNHRKSVRALCQRKQPSVEPICARHKNNVVRHCPSNSFGLSVFTIGVIESFTTNRRANRYSSFYSHTAPESGKA